MKYCRFEHDRAPHFGLIETVGGHEHITRVSQFAPENNSVETDTTRISPVALERVKLLAPVSPSKIVCVGRNYREHAAELGNEVPVEPLIFFKPPSAVIGPEQTIVRPKISTRVDHEGELGVVIGKRCRNLKTDEDVRPYILGFTCVNDVTARDLQKKKTDNGPAEKALIRFARSGRSSSANSIRGQELTSRRASTGISSSRATPATLFFRWMRSFATSRR